jgi:hypothetical protein
VGDYVGAGLSYYYTQEDAYMIVDAQEGTMLMEIRGDERWFGSFQMPDSLNRFTPGVYGSLARFPFHSAFFGGLDWSGESRGCNTLSGSFIVDSARYRRDSLTALALRFEQHCEGASAALRGTIFWNSADTAEPPGPVEPPPAGLWRPPAEAVPTSGSYVYLASEVGDPIGQGDTSHYTPATTTMMIFKADAKVHVNVGSWGGVFQAMRKLDRLEPGYYPEVARYPVKSAIRGGLSFFVSGRSCSDLSGWFVVDRVTYSGEEIKSLELRFEQLCEGAPAPLRGAIRWN